MDEPPFLVWQSQIVTAINQQWHDDDDDDDDNNGNFVTRLCRSSGHRHDAQGLLQQ
jgi:hypothetical protein